MESSQPKFQFSIKEIVILDDEENQATEENQLKEQELEDLIQQGTSVPEQGETVTEILQQPALNPPQSVVTAINDPIESDQEESASALIQRKRKRKDPTEPSPVIQDVQSPINESIPMDQDVQSPIFEGNESVEKEVASTELFQGVGSSSIPPVVDISKGKSKLPESELVDSFRTESFN